MTLITTTQTVTMQNLVKPVVQNNAYFSMGENIIMNMLGSKFETERTEAVVLIKKIRDQRSSSFEIKKGWVREPLAPLNWKAKNYTEMISSQEIKLEPILTQHLSISQIEEFKKTPFVGEKWPCHSVSVERMVKAVTNESSLSFGYTVRHRNLCVRRFESKNSGFKTKRDFCFPSDYDE